MMAKKGKFPEKPKIPLLLPREHVIYLCQLPAYRKDFEVFLSRMKNLHGKRRKTILGSPDYFSITEEMKKEHLAFGEKWGLKKPIDPVKEEVSKISWVMPHTDDRVGDPVSIVRWKKPREETPFEDVRLPIRGLGTPIHETDIIGGRRLQIEVDLSYPWEGALKDEIKAIILAARKLAGAPRKVDGEMFSTRVHAASRAIGSQSPSIIGKIIDPVTYPATRKGDRAARTQATKKWKALQERIRAVLNS